MSGQAPPEQGVLARAHNGRPRLGLTEMGVAKCVCCFQLRTHGRGLLVGIKNDAMKKEETLKFKHREDVQGPHVWHPGEGEADEETSYLELTGPDAEQS